MIYVEGKGGSLSSQKVDVWVLGAREESVFE